MKRLTFMIICCLAIIGFVDLLPGGTVDESGLEARMKMFDILTKVAIISILLEYVPDVLEKCIKNRAYRNFAVLGVFLVGLLVTVQLFEPDIEMSKLEEITAVYMGLVLVGAVLRKIIIARKLGKPKEISDEKEEQ